MINLNKFLKNIQYTQHSKQRLKRLKKQEYNLKDIYKYKIIDRLGINSKLELHIICNDATVLVFNLQTKKLITVLNARVNQIKRYKIFNKKILKNAKINQEKNLNNL